MVCKTMEVAVMLCWGMRDSTAPEELKGGRHQLWLLHTDRNNPEPGQTN